VKTDVEEAHGMTSTRRKLAGLSADEAAAATRSIGVTTLMRQIIEDWARTHSDAPALIRSASSYVT